MKLTTITIPELMEKIDKNQLLIPHLQRNYVWKEQNIYNYFDSIMRNYPFPQFYFWNKKKEINARTLIKDYKKLNDKDYINMSKTYKGSSKWLILDGQQRIQSLYIALMGSRNDKEIYLNLFNTSKIISKDGSFSKFEFKFFKAAGNKQIGFVKVKDLFKALRKVKLVNFKVLNSLYKSIDNWMELIEFARENDFESNVSDIITHFHVAFVQSEFYHAIIKDEDHDEEVFNVFARINNGGMKISYADLIFIYFKTFWKEAQEKFSELLSKIPKGFSIDYEFLVKTSITLLKNKCEFDISLIDKTFVEELKENWKTFSNSIVTTFEVLHKVYIYNNSTLRSNISIIPVIYAVFHKKINHGIDSDNFKNDLKKYVYISHIKNVFNSKPETTVNKIISNYLANSKFDSDLILKLIIGNNYKLTKDDVSSVSARKNVKLILNLIYFNEDRFLTKKNSQNFKLDIDHIFPKSDCEDYFDDKNEYNDILNYCYLTSEKNRKNKQTIPPFSFFTEKGELHFHLIPENSLFQYNVKDYDPNFREHFLTFKKKRLKLIVDKLNKQIIK